MLLGRGRNLAVNGEANTASREWAMNGPRLAAKTDPSAKIFYFSHPAAAGRAQRKLDRITGWTR